MTTARGQALLAVVSTIAVAGALATAQRIATNYAWRVDLTPDHRYLLSAQAVRALADLRQDVTVTAFERADDPHNRDIDDLLRQVGAASPHVRSRTVDINRNPAVARQYGVGNYGALVVESGGREKTLTSADERSLVGAIRRATTPLQHVYVVTGHGERRIDDSDRQLGYSLAKTALQDEQYDVRPLALADHAVPDDASVVVIAGPRSDLLASELMALDAYVHRGGGLLVMVDPTTEAPSLFAFLRAHGVEVRKEIVLDPDNRLFAGDYLTMAIPDRAAEHPVSAALQAVPLMSQVRSVARANSDGVELLHSSPQSWGTRDRSVLRSGMAERDAEHDTRGPLPVGVGIGGTAASPGRVLVYGDSDFATNFFLEYLGNRDLWLNSVNWLAREDALIGSRNPTKTPGVKQFFLSARQGRLIFWLSTVVQPALMLAVGAVVLWLRRREG